MSLEARIAKLERTHSRILRCPWCRFSLCSQSPSTTNRPDEPADVLQTKCWFCGTNFVVPLRGLNEYQREVVDLIYNSHPITEFVNERVYAARIWSAFGSEVDAYRTEEGETNHQRPSRRWSDDKAKRDHERLEQQAMDFWSIQRERFKRLAKGPESFPLDKTFEAIDLEYPASSYDAKTDQLLESLGLQKYSQGASHLRSALTFCNLHLRMLKKREACEFVIWGKCLSDTINDIAFFEQQKQAKINEAIRLNPLGEGNPAI